MRTYRVATGLLAAAGLSACGQNYFVKGHALAPAGKVDVITAPAGATATNAHGNTCVTPCTLPLLTADGGEITLALAGYRTERHYVGARVSDRKIAMQAADYAVEAIDPDPFDIALTALSHAIAGRGGVQELDTRRIETELIELEEGEEDLLADARPLTGERIAIDLSEPSS